MTYLIVMENTYEFIDLWCSYYWSKRTSKIALVYIIRNYLFLTSTISICMTF